ncbi:ORF123 [Ranid herpesvirus 2]|uniref:ORF123 n=1 Tax=Ranid herpesvirus 2 TaxID=389214 RepID=Q14VY3_9VIRU|nr:ORF123 [Ranid herpesvirus 2]ABG25573.1 ORF123 [Ranid herpesvirus 2]
MEAEIRRLGKEARDATNFIYNCMVNQRNQVTRFTERNAAHMPDAAARLLAQGPDVLFTVPTFDGAIIPPVPTQAPVFASTSALPQVSAQHSNVLPAVPVFGVPVPLFTPDSSLPPPPAPVVASTSALPPAQPSTSTLPPVVASTSALPPAQPSTSALPPAQPSTSALPSAQPSTSAATLPQAPSSVQPPVPTPNVGLTLELQCRNMNREFGELLEQQRLWLTEAERIGGRKLLLQDNYDVPTRPSAAPFAVLPIPPAADQSVDMHSLPDLPPPPQSPTSLYAMPSAVDLKRPIPIEQNLEQQMRIALVELKDIRKAQEEFLSTRKRFKHADKCKQGSVQSYIEKLAAGEYNPLRSGSASNYLVVADYCGAPLPQLPQEPIFHDPGRGTILPIYVPNPNLQPIILPSPSSVSGAQPLLQLTTSQLVEEARKNADFIKHTAASGGVPCGRFTVPIQPTPKPPPSQPVVPLHFPPTQPAQHILPAAPPATQPAQNAALPPPDTETRPPDGTPAPPADTLETPNAATASTPPSEPHAPADTPNAAPASLPPPEDVIIPPPPPPPPPPTNPTPKVPANGVNIGGEIYYIFQRTAATDRPAEAAPQPNAEAREVDVHPPPKEEITKTPEQRVTAVVEIEATPRLASPEPVVELPPEHEVEAEPEAEASPEPEAPPLENVELQISLESPARAEPSPSADVIPKPDEHTPGELPQEWQGLEKDMRELCRLQGELLGMITDLTPKVKGQIDGARKVPKIYDPNLPYTRNVASTISREDFDKIQTGLLKFWSPDVSYPSTKLELQPPPQIPVPASDLELPPGGSSPHTQPESEVQLQLGRPPHTAPPSEFRHPPGSPPPHSPPAREGYEVSSPGEEYAEPHGYTSPDSSSLHGHRYNTPPSKSKKLYTYEARNRTLGAITQISSDDEDEELPQTVRRKKSSAEQKRLKLQLATRTKIECRASLRQERREKKKKLDEEKHLENYQTYLKQNTQLPVSKSRTEWPPDKPTKKILTTTRNKQIPDRPDISHYLRPVLNRKILACGNEYDSQTLVDRPAPICCFPSHYTLQLIFGRLYEPITFGTSTILVRQLVLAQYLINFRCGAYANQLLAIFNVIHVDELSAALITKFQKDSLAAVQICLSDDAVCFYMPDEEWLHAYMCEATVYEHYDFVRLLCAAFCPRAYETLYRDYSAQRGFSPFHIRYADMLSSFYVSEPPTTARAYHYKRLPDYKFNLCRALAQETHTFSTLIDYQAEYAALLDRALLSEDEAFKTAALGLWQKYLTANIKTGHGLFVGRTWVGMVGGYVTFDQDSMDLLLEDWKLYVGTPNISPDSMLNGTPRSLILCSTIIVCVFSKYADRLRGTVALLWNELCCVWSYYMCAVNPASLRLCMRLFLRGVKHPKMIEIFDEYINAHCDALSSEVVEITRRAVEGVLQDEGPPVLYNAMWEKPESSIILELLELEYLYTNDPNTWYNLTPEADPYTVHLRSLVRQKNPHDNHTLPTPFESNKVSVSGDGNCFYYCVAAAYGMRPEAAQSIRDIAVQTYTEIMHTDPFFSSTVDPKDAEEQLRDYVYATEGYFQSLAYFLRINVVIYIKGQSQPSIYGVNDDRYPYLSLLFSGHVSSGHFDLYYIPSGCLCNSYSKCMYGSYGAEATVNAIVTPTILCNIPPCGNRKCIARLFYAHTTVEDASAMYNEDAFDAQYRVCDTLDFTFLNPRPTLGHFFAHGTKYGTESSEPGEKRALKRPADPIPLETYEQFCKRNPVTYTSDHSSYVSSVLEASSAASEESDNGEELIREFAKSVGEHGREFLRIEDEKLKRQNSVQSTRTPSPEERSDLPPDVRSPSPPASPVKARDGRTSPTPAPARVEPPPPPPPPSTPSTQPHPTQPPPSAPPTPVINVKPPPPCTPPAETTPPIRTQDSQPAVPAKTEHALPSVPGTPPPFAPARVEDSRPPPPRQEPSLPPPSHPRPRQEEAESDRHPHQEYLRPVRGSAADWATNVQPYLPAPIQTRPREEESAAPIRSRSPRRPSSEEQTLPPVQTPHPRPRHEEAESDRHPHQEYLSPVRGSAADWATDIQPYLPAPRGAQRSSSERGRLLNYEAPSPLTDEWVELDPHQQSSRGRASQGAEARGRFREGAQNAAFEYDEELESLDHPLEQLKSLLQTHRRTLRPLESYVSLLGCHLEHTADENRVRERFSEMESERGFSLRLNEGPAASLPNFAVNFTSNRLETTRNTRDGPDVLERDVVIRLPYNDLQYSTLHHGVMYLTSKIEGAMAERLLDCDGAPYDRTLIKCHALAQRALLGMFADHLEMPDTLSKYIFYNDLKTACFALPIAYRDIMQVTAHPKLAYLRSLLFKSLQLEHTLALDVLGLKKHCAGPGKAFLHQEVMLFSPTTKRLHTALYIQERLNYLDSSATLRQPHTNVTDQQHLLLPTEVAELHGFQVCDDALYMAGEVVLQAALNDDAELVLHTLARYSYKVIPFVFLPLYARMNRCDKMMQTYFVMAIEFIGAQIHTSFDQLVEAVNSEKIEKLHDAMTTLCIEYDVQVHYETPTYSIKDVVARCLNSFNPINSTHIPKYCLSKRSGRHEPMSSSTACYTAGLQAVPYIYYKAEEERQERLKSWGCKVKEQCDKDFRMWYIALPRHLPLPSNPSVLKRNLEAAKGAGQSRRVCALNSIKERFRDLYSTFFRADVVHGIKLLIDVVHVAPTYFDLMAIFHSNQEVSRFRMVMATYWQNVAPHNSGERESFMETEAEGLPEMETEGEALNHNDEVVERLTEIIRKLQTELRGLREEHNVTTEQLRRRECAVVQKGKTDAEACIRCAELSYANQALSTTNASLSSLFASIKSQQERGEALSVTSDVLKSVEIPGVTVSPNTTLLNKMSDAYTTLVSVVEKIKPKVRTLQSQSDRYASDRDLEAFLNYHPSDEDLNRVILDRVSDFMNVMAENNTLKKKNSLLESELLKMELDQGSCVRVEVTEFCSLSREEYRALQANVNTVTAPIVSLNAQEAVPLLLGKLEELYIYESVHWTSFFQNQMEYNASLKHYLLANRLGDERLFVSSNLILDLLLTSFSTQTQDSTTQTRYQTKTLLVHLKESMKQEADNYRRLMLQHNAIQKEMAMTTLLKEEHQKATQELVKYRTFVNKAISASTASPEQFQTSLKALLASTRLVGLRN